MNKEIQQHIAEKVADRQREVLLLASKKESPMSLGRENFCLKGLNLPKARRSHELYAIFQ